MFRSATAALFIMVIATSMSQLTQELTSTNRDGEVILSINDEQKVQYLNQNFESDAYKYGYDINPHGQFHHETRGPHGITYGCYGYVDPFGQLKTTFYISDGWGYRVVQPGKDVELFLHKHEHHANKDNNNHHEHHGIITPWQELYFPVVCAQYTNTNIPSPAIPNGGTPIGSGSMIEITPSQSPYKPDSSGSPRPDISSTSGKPSTVVSETPGISSYPGQLGTPSIPDILGTSGIPGKPSKPETFLYPGHPEIPSISSTSSIELSGRPSYPEHSGTPGILGIPGRPGKLGTPSYPGQPETSGMPGTLETHEIPRRPGKPGTPLHPGHPETPGMPSTPGTHGRPGRPGTPSYPKHPGSPSIPGTLSTSEIPRRPVTPLYPGHQGTPCIPGTSRKPSIPGIQLYPGHPGTPSISDTSAGIPELPGIPGKPGTPLYLGHPGTPVIYGTPGRPSKPEISLYPGHPGTPDIPGTPGRPGKPGISLYPGHPGTSDIPGTPGRPGKPGISLYPGHPGTPDILGTPGKPGKPGISSFPGHPATSGTTGTPGLLGISGKPETPSYPGHPGISDVSGSPGTPGTLETLGISLYPGRPETPNIPSITIIPGRPNTPGMFYPEHPIISGSPGKPNKPSGIPSFFEHPGTPVLSINTGISGKPGTAVHPGHPGISGIPDTSGISGTSGKPGTLHPGHPQPSKVPGLPLYSTYPNISEKPGKPGYPIYSVTSEIPDAPSYSETPNKPNDLSHPETISSLNRPNLSFKPSKPDYPDYSTYPEYTEDSKSPESSIGFEGSVGNGGPIGSVGDIGGIGSVGDKGDVGPDGPDGPWPTGSPGPDGPWPGDPDYMPGIKSTKKPYNEPISNYSAIYSFDTDKYNSVAQYNFHNKTDSSYTGYSLKDIESLKFSHPMKVNTSLHIQHKQYRPQYETQSMSSIYGKKETIYNANKINSLLHTDSTPLKYEIRDQKKPIDIKQFSVHDRNQYQKSIFYPSYNSQRQSFKGSNQFNKLEQEDGAFNVDGQYNNYTNVDSKPISSASIQSDGPSSAPERQVNAHLEQTTRTNLALDAIGVQPPSSINVKTFSLPIGPNPQACPCYLVEPNNNTNVATSSTVTSIIQGQVGFIPVIFVPYCPGNEMDSNEMKVMFPSATPVSYACDTCDTQDSKFIVKTLNINLGNIDYLKEALNQTNLGFLNVPVKTVERRRSKSRKTK